MGPQRTLFAPTKEMGESRSPGPDFVGRLTSPDYFGSGRSSLFGKPRILCGEASVTGVYL